MSEWYGKSCSLEREYSMDNNPFVFEVTYNTKARKEKYTLKLKADNTEGAWTKLGHILKVLECFNISMRELGRERGLIMAADIEDIRKELRKHDYLYYMLAIPEIEDYDYDMLFKRLQEMEAADPSLVTEDSPTQCVGGKSAEIHMQQNGIKER